MQSANLVHFLKGPSSPLPPPRLSISLPAIGVGLPNKAVISYLDDNKFRGGGGDGRTGKKGNRSVGGQESVRLSRLESRVGLASLTNLPASAPPPPQIYQPRAAADARKQKSTWEAPR